MPKVNNKVINLDHAAGTSLNNTAKKQILKFLSEEIYNPDSSYQPAVKIRRELADLKNKLAKLLGVNSPNIFITNGSSDASSFLLNLILPEQSNTSDASNISVQNPEPELITTNVEHQTLIQKIKERPHKIISVNPDSGILNLKDLEKEITNSTILISIQYTNNETGINQPIKDISRLVKKINTERKERGNKLPLFFHSDASQSALTEDLQIPRLGVDALSLNGSKFGALPNSGILYLSSNILRYLESKNTKLKLKKENPLSLISLYYALQDAIQKKPNTNKNLTKLAQAFNKEFLELNPKAHLNPKNLKIGKNHAPHILNYLVPNVSGEKLVILAGLNGILISTGAACSANKEQPSHVLKALDLSLEQIQSSIRISLGKNLKTENDAKSTAKKLSKLTQEESVRINPK